jgi:hypothetical protein
VFEYRALKKEAIEESGTFASGISWLFLFHNQYQPDDQLKKDDMGKAGMTRVTQRLCGYTYRKENTWERKCRLDDNIRMDLKDIGCDGSKCIYEAEVRNK